MIYNIVCEVKILYVKILQELVHLSAIICEVKILYVVKHSTTTLTSRSRTIMDFTLI